MDDKQASRRDPDLPIPISLIAGRYLLFDIDAAIFLRREHNICGYNIGTLAQIPSQNSFLGLPVILMPEEAQVLVDSGIGYILDDTAAHKSAIYNRDPTRVSKYHAQVDEEARFIQTLRAEEQMASRNRHLDRSSKSKPKAQTDTKPTDSFGLDEEGDNHEPINNTASKQSFVPSSMQPQYITPTTSSPLIPHENHIISKPKTAIPNLPHNYPLFRHLHSRGYFMTPGLRFGCQYTTYPGDPLRFHSHFLTTDLGWQEGMNLMDIVGGGRLGTGVKKGFLIGAHDESKVEKDNKVNEKAEVRTFSIEWAVM